MIKKKVHIDIEKLHAAMLEKEEQVPTDFTDFLKDLQCPDLSYGEICICDFLSIRNHPFDEDDFPAKLMVYADLMQRIQEFISFYYNIYDEVIYLEREV